MKNDSVHHATLSHGGLRTAIGLFTAAALCWIAPASANAATPAAASVAGTATSASSAAAPASGSDNGTGQLQRWVQESAASTWSATNGDAPPADGVRVEVSVGPLNPNLRLPECARMEPFLPQHARLWGRGYVGMRCVEGASWSTMVPVNVSVYGPALIATTTLAAGSVVDAASFRVEETDWTRGRGAPIADPAALNGQVLVRAIPAGQALRATDLKAAMAVAAGDPIRVRVLGDGFTVSATGVAMSGGAEGQPLRVRTENGKVLVGTLRDRSVEVKL